MTIARLPPGFLVRPPTLDDAETVVALLTTDANTVGYPGYPVEHLRNTGKRQVSLKKPTSGW